MPKTQAAFCDPFIAQICPVSLCFFECGQNQLTIGTHTILLYPLLHATIVPSQQVRRLFEKAHKDQNGCVTKVQLISRITFFGRVLQLFQFTVILNCRKNGTEFWIVQDATPQCEFLCLILTPRPRWTLREEVDEFFSLHDRDFDGKLSINDLTGKVQELFQMCDKDMFCQNFFWRKLQWRQFLNQWTKTATGLWRKRWLDN